MGSRIGQAGGQRRPIASESERRKRMRVISDVTLITFQKIVHRQYVESGLVGGEPRTRI